MKISVVSGSPAERAVDVLAIAVRSSSTSGPAKDKKKKAERPSRELQSVDRALDGALTAAMEAESFTGDAGQTFSFHTHGKMPARRVVVVGLGAKDKIVEDTWRRFGGAAAKAAVAAKAKRLAIVLPEDGAPPLKEKIERVVEGAVLSGYRFDRYLTKDRDKARLEALEVHTPKKVAADESVARGEAVAAAVALARDLVNEPAGALTPMALAELAQKEAKAAGLKVSVLDEAALKKERMGMLLAVARAAAPYAPPRVVKLTYKPKEKAKRKVALVGKGLTFDTGGLDIKPSASMLDMKIDMSGAAAVLGTMIAVAHLKPHVEVVGYMGCVENGIGGNAYHPGDVLTSRKGLTVEINNTDAEGRLVLGDVLDLALTEEEPDIVVDLATLTGACMVALGPSTAGLFTDDDRLAEDIAKAGRRAGEDFWRLPLNEELFGQLKSPIADMKNTGERYGGAITAALFLKQFVDGRARWAHLDIAGPVTTEKDGEYTPKGATGFGVRTLLGLLGA